MLEIESKSFKKREICQVKGILSLKGYEEGPSSSGEVVYFQREPKPGYES